MGNIFKTGKRRRRLGLLLTLGLFVACSHTAPPAQQAKTPYVPETGSLSVEPPRTDRLPSIEQRLRAAVHQWEGTPHRMGGTTRRGVDCSGFVQRLYQDLFNRHIPRSTALQVRAGTTITLGQVQPGDLVFFRPPYKVRHVGIYLGSGEFAHASTSKGVTVSQMHTPYWRKAYWTARRYLPRQQARRHTVGYSQN